MTKKTTKPKAKKKQATTKPAAKKTTVEPPVDPVVQAEGKEKPRHGGRMVYELVGKVEALVWYIGDREKTTIEILQNCKRTKKETLADLEEAARLIMEVNQSSGRMYTRSMWKLKELHDEVCEILYSIQRPIWRAIDDIGNTPVKNLELIYKHALGAYGYVSEHRRALEALASRLSVKCYYYGEMLGDKADLMAGRQVSEISDTESSGSLIRQANQQSTAPGKTRTVDELSSLEVIDRLRKKEFVSIAEFLMAYCEDWKINKNTRGVITQSLKKMGLPDPHDKNGKPIAVKKKRGPGGSYFYRPAEFIKRWEGYRRLDDSLPELIEITT